jgi:hypothetical protein
MDKKSVIEGKDHKGWSGKTKWEACPDGQCEIELDPQDKTKPKGVDFKDKKGKTIKILAVKKSDTCKEDNGCKCFIVAALAQGNGPAPKDADHIWTGDKERNSATVDPPAGTTENDLKSYGTNTFWTPVTLDYFNNSGVEYVYGAVCLKVYKEDDNKSTPKHKKGEPKLPESK